MVAQTLGYISNLDSAILYAVQSIGPAWESVARLLSHGVGSYVVMLPIFFVALFCIRKHRIALELLVVCVVSFAVIFLLKIYFQAPRPYIVDPMVVMYDEDGGFGLPSAHAAMSVVILGWVALRHPKSHTLLWGSVALVILIGASRLYLGVHYPSQVLAGWVLGILLLYVFSRASQRLWSPFKKEIRKRG